MKFAFFILWLLHWLPLPWIDKLARPLSWIGWKLAHERRHVGMTNLRMCFPEKDEAWRTKIIRENFHAMMRMILEYGVMWHASPARLKRLVTLKNMHYLEAHRDENVVLLYSHFVGLEMCAYRFNLERAFVGMYSKQKNAQFDQRIYQGRMRFNNAKMLSRQEGVRSIVRAMRDHTPLLYVPDQDLGPKESIFVPFFGHPAATISSLSRLAKLAKARVVPVVARRIGHRYEMEFFPAWEAFPTEDIVADTRRMNAFVEARIREQPEQYFWLHKRFKTRPEGEARIY